MVVSYFVCPQGCYDGQSNRGETRHLSQVAGTAEGSRAVNSERTEESRHT